MKLTIEYLIVRVNMGLTGLNEIRKHGFIQRRWLYQTCIDNQLVLLTEHIGRSFIYSLYGVIVIPSF